MNSLPFCLETERLLLRDFVSSDWTAIFAMSQEPTVISFQTWLRLDNEQAAQHWVDEAIYHNRLQPRSGYNLAVVEKESQRVIGWLGWGGPSEPESENEFDFGYALMPDAWGQGYMSEALQAAVAFMFDTLSASRVYGECAKRNVASARVMEKAGLVLVDEWVENDPETGQSDIKQRYEVKP